MKLGPFPPSSAHPQKGNGREPVSSYQLDMRDLRQFDRGGLESRGTVADVPSQRVGTLAAFTLGWRVIR